ncbi:hypothetical protein [Mycolicibacterium vaccae]|uniref:hypothetical protein n=1 Tax=Mycolicibacterium vaccae TaxID=1810 RepID=UPI003D0350FB
MFESHISVIVHVNEFAARPRVGVSGDEDVVFHQRATLLRKLVVEIVSLPVEPGTPCIANSAVAHQKRTRQRLKQQ